MAERPRREGSAPDRPGVDAEPLPIVTGSEQPVLRQPAQPVRRVTRDIRRLLDRMAATMYAADGVGLAAPQVGVAKRIIVCDVGDGLIELINPEIVRRGDETEAAFEGCLSLPRVLAEVERPATVQVTGLDRRGRRVWIEGDGLLARCLQHEIDHLDGVLITDRARRIIHLPPESDLRVVFMGTPEFAVPSLEELLRRYVKVVGVVTQPDRRQGRGLHPVPPPVKRVAEDRGLPVLQPEKLDAAVVEQLAAWRPDLLVVVAYGRVLPAEVLAVPRVGAVNLHASLLPRHRGPAPIQHAILAGDRVTGVTTLWMDQGLDTGDVILQREVPLEDGMTAGQLHDVLARAGAELLGETLRQVAEGRAPRRPQDDAQATWAPKLTAADEWIDWERPAAEVSRRIRALDPRPGARTWWRGQLLKVYGAGLQPVGTEAAGTPGASAGTPAAPGTVVEVTPSGIAIQCQDRPVWVRRLQPSGRRPLTVQEFVNGYRLAGGDRFERPPALAGSGRKEG